MRFLLDMNLPPAMADWLRSDGHDAVHVCEIGRIVVTFDLDFGEIVGLAGAAGSGVGCCGSDWLVKIICAHGFARPLRRRERLCKLVLSFLSKMLACASGGCRQGIERK